MSASRGAAVTPRQIRKAFGADAAAGWARLTGQVAGLSEAVQQQHQRLAGLETAHKLNFDRPRIEELERQESLAREQMAKLIVATRNHLDRIKALEAVGTRQAESFRARLRFFVFGR